MMMAKYPCKSTSIRPGRETVGAAVSGEEERGACGGPIRQLHSSVVEMELACGKGRFACRMAPGHGSETSIRERQVAVFIKAHPNATVFLPAWLQTNRASLLPLSRIAGRDDLQEGSRRLFPHWPRPQ